MRPLKLNGHRREITRVRYNADGDLLFSASADPPICVWYTSDGERLGTYDISGAVFDLDTTHNSELLCAAGYSAVTVFDCETGKLTSKLATGSAINKTCGFSLSGNLVMAGRKAGRGEKSKLFIFDIRDGSQIREAPSPAFTVDLALGDSSDECTVAAWAGLDNNVLVGMASGEIQMWDVRSAQGRPEPAVRRQRAHDSPISDLQVSRDQTMVVTCSPDGYAKLWGAFQLDPFKQFKADRPLNSVAISPTKPHILTGGGQLARDVALTGGAGQFEALFYHLVFEDLFAKVKDHFGPIRSLVFSPDGTGYASGAHDGMIFLHKFDANYDKYELEY